MDKVEFKLPKYWSMSGPVLNKEESEMENLNSAGTYRLESRLRYWGFRFKYVRYVRFHLFDKSNRKIKTVSGNCIEDKVLNLGSSVKLSFLIEVPRNVSYVKVEPILYEGVSSIWAEFLNVFGTLTLIMFFGLQVLRIIF